MFPISGCPVSDIHPIYDIDTRADIGNICLTIIWPEWYTFPTSSGYHVTLKLRVTLIIRMVFAADMGTSADTRQACYMLRTCLQCLRQCLQAVFFIMY